MVKRIKFCENIIQVLNVAVLNLKLFKCYSKKSLNSRFIKKSGAISAKITDTFSKLKRVRVTKASLRKIEKFKMQIDSDSLDIYLSLYYVKKKRTKKCVPKEVSVESLKMDKRKKVSLMTKQEKFYYNYIQVR